MTGYKKYKQPNAEWLTQVPSHWLDTKIKYLVLENDSVFIDGDWIESKVIVDDGIRYITTGNVKEGFYSEQGNGHINEKTFNELNCTEVFEGDLLISRLNLPIGRACIVPNLNKRIVTSVDNVILRPDSNVCKHFLLYLFSSKEYFEHTELIARGATMQRISRGLLGNIRLSLPPIEEQTQIAKYLDQKTTQIDNLISKKEQLIQLLEEERIAIINQAVTKGLNPEAPMKDSGIEWLGEIPEHWTVSRIGYVAKVVRGASPRPAGDPLLFNGDFMPWITVKEVTNAKGKFITQTETFLTELGAKQTRILEPETLILSNSGATLGVPRVTLIRGAINDGSVAFINLEIEREFLYYFFTTHTQIYRDEAAGSGQPNLNTDIVKSTRIPLPPRQEQISIVEFVEEKLKQFEMTISKMGKEVDLLKEYKTALISEVVTGKVDVRNEILN